MIAALDAMAAEHRARTGHNTCRSDIARGVIVAALAQQSAVGR